MGRGRGGHVPQISQEGFREGARQQSEKINQQRQLLTESYAETEKLRKQMNIQIAVNAASNAKAERLAKEVVQVNAKKDHAYWEMDRMRQDYQELHISFLEQKHELDQKRSMMLGDGFKEHANNQIKQLRDGITRMSMSMEEWKRVETETKKVSDGQAVGKAPAREGGGASRPIAPTFTPVGGKRMEVDDAGTLKRDRDWSLTPDGLPAGKQLEFAEKGSIRCQGLPNLAMEKTARGATGPSAVVLTGDELGDAGGQEDDTSSTTPDDSGSGVECNVFDELWMKTKKVGTTDGDGGGGDDDGGGRITGGCRVTETMVRGCAIKMGVTATELLTPTGGNTGMDTLSTKAMLKLIVVKIIGKERSIAEVIADLEARVKDSLKSKLELRAQLKADGKKGGTGGKK